MGRVLGHPPIIRASLFALLVTLTSLAQQPKVLAPHRPIDPRVEKRSKWMMPQTPRSMIGGLWMTDANLKSSIYIRNVVERPRHGDADSVAQQRQAIHAPGRDH